MPINAVRAGAFGSPIFVIAGFLGSGQTTLLKRVLAHELDRGVKPAVLMNEFRGVDGDGAVLQEHPRSKDIELQSLLTDCICCDLSGEFSEKVGHLVQRAKGAPLFIETAGLADIRQVVIGVERALSADNQTGKAAHLASVIVLVDTPKFLKLAHWPAADRHLRQADTIVLEKLDQIPPEGVAVVVRRIMAANTTARVLRSTHADVALSKLLTSAHAHRAPVVTDGVIKDAAAGYQSSSVRLTLPVGPARMKAWVHRCARTVVRLKGFVRVAWRRGFLEVQWIMGSYLDDSLCRQRTIARQTCGDHPAWPDSGSYRGWNVLCGRRGEPHAGAGPEKAPR